MRSPVRSRVRNDFDEYLGCRECFGNPGCNLHRHICAVPVDPLAPTVHKLFQAKGGGGPLNVVLKPPRARSVR